MGVVFRNQKRLERLKVRLSLHFITNLLFAFVYFLQVLPSIICVKDLYLLYPQNKQKKSFRLLYTLLYTFMHTEKKTVQYVP